MDPRHESFKQGLLNHIINTINLYIRDNTDAIVQSPFLLNAVRGICKRIYAYLGVPVDVDEIISRQNLLSIDVVMLPAVEDPEAGKILNEDDFLHLLEYIHEELQRSALAAHHDKLSDCIHDVLTQHIV